MGAIINGNDIYVGGGGSGSGGDGTSNYEELNNLPSIEGVELIGNKTLADFGGKQQIKISWKDYQELPTDEQNNESIVYFIYDYPDNVVNARDISYDNTASGVEATEVQGAIDNLYATRSLKTYTSLEQLGMSTDNTITEIMTVLPINTDAIFNTAQISSNLTAELPNGAQAGMLHFHKGGNDARGILTFEPYSSDEVYKNRYYNSAFQGWRKLVEQSEIVLTVKSISVTVEANSYSRVASGITSLENYEVASATPISYSQYLTTELQYTGSQFYIVARNLSDTKKENITVSVRVLFIKK